MPGWLQAISKVNPLSHEVSALRGLLIAMPTNLALDAGVLTGADRRLLSPSLPAPPAPRALSFRGKPLLPACAGAIVGGPGVC